MDIDHIPAEVFPPGEYLQDELGERGWTVPAFAGLVGHSVEDIEDVLAGRAPVTPKLATAFATALGTSPQFWLNMDACYRKAGQLADHAL